MKILILFFLGRAGYISGAIWLKSIFQQDFMDLSHLFPICDAMVQSGKEYVQRKCNQRQKLPPLMYSYYETEYLGAAHGLCAILQMLISVPGYIQQSYGHVEIKNSIDFLLELQTHSGNFPCAMDETPPYR